MEDAGIIGLYFERDQSALDETAKKYGAYLNQVAYNILRCKEDSEEIVEDTYYGAWNAIPPTRPAVLKHFLSRITRNLSFSRLDYTTAKRRNAGAVELLSELDECIPDKRGSAESQWEAQQIGAEINRFLATLSREDCAVFLSRYYYAMTLKEVARKYALPERKVKYLLSNLRLQLKKHLNKEGVVI